MGAENTFDNAPVVQKSEVVLIAVKPHIIPIALADLKKVPDVKADKLFVSVAMGVTTKQLQQVRCHFRTAVYMCVFMYVFLIVTA